MLRSRALPWCAAFLLVPTLGRAQCSVVIDVEPGASGSFPNHLTASWGNVLFFTARSPWGEELFRWDPVAGAGLVRDIRAGATGAGPQELAWGCTAQGPRLFFSAAETGIDRELWTSDGTTAGTQRVADIRPGSSPSTPGPFAACDGRMLFAADDGTHGRELWISDGTLAGTQLVADLNPGAGGSSPDALTCANGLVFFTAWEPSTGRELYVSDGTPAGTQLLRDVNPGTAFGGIGLLTALGSRVYFAALDPALGSELWTSDGTPAGTHVVLDIVPNSGSSSPVELEPCGDTLYFVARDPGRSGAGVWRTDGTAAGTVLVVPASLVSSPANLTCSGGRLFFAASTFAEGTELWVSDGTTAGTHLVADVSPGTSSSFPQFLAASGDGVCFHAVGPNGRELWFSDGTTTGTFELCDLNPGAASSNPRDLVTCHGRLFFAADSATFGNELHWVPTPGATQTRLGDGSLPSRPQLFVQGERPPILGTTITLEARGPAGSVGIVIMGLPIVGPLPLPGLVQGGCDWMGFLGGAYAELGSTLQPAWTSALPVPGQSTLEGVVVNVQAFWIDPVGVPLLQVSNGLQLALGSARAF